jgi:hypothetical protein
MPPVSASSVRSADAIRAAARVDFSVISGFGMQELTVRNRVLH